MKNSINDYAEHFEERDDFQTQKNKILSGGRGFLEKYADPSKIPLEKEAGRLHAINKYGSK